MRPIHIVTASPSPACRRRRVTATISSGGMVENNVAPSFNTLQINAYEDMTVEQWDDPLNRMVKGRVVQDIAPVLAAPLSGYLIASTAS